MEIFNVIGTKKEKTQRTYLKNKKFCLMHYTWLAFRPKPIRKLSGFMSRWRNPRECIYSTLFIYRRDIKEWAEQNYSVRYYLKKDWQIYQLICKHQNCLQRQFPIAVVEQVFQAWPKEINNHYIVITLSSKPFEMGDPRFIYKQSILEKN